MRRHNGVRDRGRLQPLGADEPVVSIADAKEFEAYSVFAHTEVLKDPIRIVINRDVFKIQSMAENYASVLVHELGHFYWHKHRKDSAMTFAFAQSQHGEGIAFQSRAEDRSQKGGFRILNSEGYWLERVFGYRVNTNPTNDVDVNGKKIVWLEP